MLVVSLAGLAVFAGPILSIVGFVRGRAMRGQIDTLTSDIESLRAQVHALSRRMADSDRTAPRPTGASHAVSAPPASPGPDVVAPRSSDRSGAPPVVPIVPTAATTPPSPPPLPPAPAPAPASDPMGPAPSAAQTFDWESMLGIRGAAWLGGITLVLAAMFFAKWSIEQGFFSPVIRISTMLVAGAGALLWAELKLRGEYQATANAVSGAGVVILYAAFFAGHSLYQLFSLPVAFAAMALVTMLAGLIAVRFAAQFTALLGLAGGLATPVLLSTGVDRPWGFFSYLALLAAGFLFVAERRAWVSVTALAMAGTSTLELGWYQRWMSPDTLAVGTVAFATLGGIHLWHAVRMRGAGQPAMHQAGVIGAVVPLGFAILLAGNTHLAGQWAGIAAFLLSVDVALVLTALRWDMPLLVGGSAVATGLVAVLLGDGHRLVESMAWGPPLAMIALAIGYNLIPRAATRVGAGSFETHPVLPLVTSAATVGGLVGFAWLATSGGRLPLWSFVALVATSFTIVVDRTHGRTPAGAFGAAVFALAWTCLHWVTTVSTVDSYPDQLTLPHLFATCVAIVAGWRTLRPGSEGSWWQSDHAGTLAATLVAYLAVLNGLDAGAGRWPLPLFALVGLDVLLLVAVAIHVRWTVLVPVAAALSLVFSGVWHVGHFSATTATVALTAYTASYLFFLLWPFGAVRALSPWWKTQPGPWLASALIGPAVFPLYYDAWRDLMGTALVGVVPVVMAAVSVAALYGISRDFASSPDPAEQQRRLDYLALFAAITLGFIATAVPLQLDRQWITIGWALEAAAVWWLFGMLPHPGLKYFGLALFLAVGVRLLANPEVLVYQPRGAPIVNWLLYTYGVPALCCLAGAYLLRRAEQRRGPVPDYDVLMTDREVPGPLVGFIGLLLVFWLINLEIADYYSVGRYVELDLSRHLARDLTRSCAWGLYALALLGAGLWRANRGLRLVSLGFLLLTVAKVFLYDLGQLTGLYRIMSFLALGVSLIVVSLLYQRFVRRSEVPA